MENQKDPRNGFVTRYLPWLLGAIMFLVYCLSLNHWVTLANLGQVATVSGWVWQPTLLQPLLFLATLPFHWVPTAQIPIALNLFSALCASLTLVLLARSVAILPHDRTEMERQRERSDFSFLTGWPSFFPPILAVLLVGLQLTFWENATSFTGESFELLLFAIIVWLLLEFRMDEKEWRLSVAALLCGAGLADNYAYVGFFPIFIAAIIWLRGLSFFNVRFLTRMLFYGIGGLLIFFLLPIVAQFSSNFKLSFWDALRPALVMDWMALKAITNSAVRYDLLLLSLTTLLPILLISIRWSANFGDSSQIGNDFIKYILYLIYGLFFAICIWLMFDPPFSPRKFGLAPSLTLYYLAALSVGYFLGYFLLIFGKRNVFSKRGRQSDPALPKALQWVCPLVVGAVFIVAATATGTLIYKNIPIVRSVNDDTLYKYARFATQTLPPEGAIVLSDPDGASPGQLGHSIRAFLVQAMLAKEGREKKYLVADTQSLNLPPYHHFLHEKYPNIWPDIIKDKTLKPINPIGLLGILNLLSKSNNICYLNPSFGYFFEEFYQEPHGLVYVMKPLPETTLIPPPLTADLIAENETFWSNVDESVSTKIENALVPNTSAHRFNFGDWLLQHLHISPEPNQNALYIGTVYSRSLNFWGVQLQRAGDLEPAAAQFIAAKKLNPDNFTADINLDFNHRLRDKTPLQIDPSHVDLEQFGQAITWNEILDANGPFDEISYTYADGMILAQQNGFMRQATAPLTRVHQLAPDNLDTIFWLAQIYTFNRLPDRALEILHDPLTQPARFSLNETNSTEVNVLAASAYFQKDEDDRAVQLLEKEIRLHPDNTVLLTSVTQAYFKHGMYANALKVIDRKLAQTPDDPQWLFGKGFAYLQMTNYPDAISSLTRVLEIQTNNSSALFNRALAYLDSGKLDTSRADYLQLQTAYTNSIPVAFGLGEIAWRQHDTNEAIRNYQIYLANTNLNVNTAEATNVIERLRELQK